jgi:hypothetical protein
MRKLILILSLLIFSSCNLTHYFLYSKDKMNGLDFSKGKWLIGEIEVNKNVKSDLTNLVIKDFTEYLGSRVKYSMNEKLLLIPSQIPLNPSKSKILDLKKGTNFDYYINIKCKNAKNDLSNFDFTEHFYYKNQMSFAQVTIEVYDLNLGEIIYNQSSGGSIEDDNSITFKPTSKVILGCYKKIMDDIKKKSIKYSS